MNTEELKKLAEAATPGPWVSAGPSFGGEFPVYCNEVVVDREHEDDDGLEICRAPIGLERESTHDMDYIAAANPAAILKLLAELEDARTEATALRVTEENLLAELESIKAQVVPDGWQLVPKQPTEEMFFDPDDVCTNFGQSPWQAFCNVYYSLLASAPPAPQASVVKQEPMDKETKTMKLLGFIDDLIEADPERAERFIESVLAKNALRRRLADKKAAQQAKPQPLSDERVQQIHNETGAGYALIRLVENYIKE